VLSPLVALYGMATTELQTKTLVWAVVYYFMTGIGITAGKISPTSNNEPRQLTFTG
jgi:fatty-acid desaturase